MVKNRMNKALTISLITFLIQDIALLPATADANLLTEIDKSTRSVASLTVGSTVGTPIAIVRKTNDQYFACLKEFKNDSISYKFWGALSSVLVSAVAGPIKGTIYGVTNAVHYSLNKPFSKESFSLTNLDESALNQNIKDKAKGDPAKPETQPWGSLQ